MAGHIDTVCEPGTSILSVVCIVAGLESHGHVWASWSGELMSLNHAHENGGPLLVSPSPSQLALV